MRNNNSSSELGSGSIRVVLKFIGFAMKRARVAARGCSGHIVLLALAVTFSPISLVHAVSININAGATLAGNAQALAAFERAADQWESLFSDPVTINIDADLVNRGSSSILGQASSVQLETVFDIIRNQLVADAQNQPGNDIVNFLPTAAQFAATGPAGVTLSGQLAGTKANLKALGFTGLDSQFGANDATIEFNTGFSFHFDNSDGVASNAIDFETVAVHEIGYALGFVSAVDGVDQLLNQNQIGSISPRLLDLFRFEAGAEPTTNADFTTFSQYPMPTKERWILSAGIWWRYPCHPHCRYFW